MATVIDTTYKVDQTFDIIKIRKQLGIVKPAILQRMSSGKKLDKTGIDWYENVVSPMSANLGADILATDTTLSVSANVFSVGDVIEIGSERMKVTAIDLSASTITVVRGFQGTTATAHTAGDKIEIVSTVVREGSLKDGSLVSKPVKYTNICQIFQDFIVLSGSLDASSPDWSRDELMRQTREKLYRLDVLKAKSVWYGIRYDSTADEERTMGGVDFFITNKIDAGGASLTPDMIIDQITQMEIEGVFDIGLKPQVWMNTAYQKVVNDFYANEVRVTRTENKYGQVIVAFVTNVGAIEIVYDRFVKPGEVFIIDAGDIYEHPLRRQQVVKLAKDSDSNKRMIVEECTIRIGYPSAWRKIENIALP